MAEPGLIAAYLHELAGALPRHLDADDVAAEVEDHLLAAAEAAAARGLDPAEAEAHAVARFGAPSVVAKVFAEEAKRGGAVSTTLTRRAGLAAMAAPVLIVAGLLVAGAADSRQPLSGIGVALALTGVAALVFALVGLRVRHGGLGTLGRVAFWLAVAAVPLAMPFGYGGLVVLAVELGVVVALYGIAMLRAGILPRTAVVLFAFAWPAWAPVAGAITAAGGDANLYAAVPVVVTLGALMALGRAMWREPALDVRHRQGAGPLATA